MRLHMVIITNVFKRFLKDIADHNPLADVQISKRVKMGASGFAQVFMRASGEFRPRMPVCMQGQSDRRPSAIHDRALVLDLAMRLRSIVTQFGNADHARWNIQPLGCDNGILRFLAQFLVGMI